MGCIGKISLMQKRMEKLTHQISVMTLGLGTHDQQIEQRMEAINKEVEELFSLQKKIQERGKFN